VNGEEFTVLVRRVGFAVVLALLCTLWPSAASAQVSCRFVFGFADLATRLGPAKVGTCLENQRTITGPETFVLSDRLNLELQTGTAVQSTTTGVLAWFPGPNLTKFYDANGQWELTTAGTAFTNWELPGAEATAPPPSVPAPSQGTTAHGRASSICYRASTDWMISTLYATPAEKERAEAEGKAKGYLCDLALEQDGPKGVNCFLSA
jgi:hypothetical protein